MSLLFFKCCASQTKKDSLRYGSYSGGICMDGGICGYWILKPDSSFIFVNFEGSNIKSFGAGMWYLLKDSTIQFMFTDDIAPILQLTKTQYFSATKEPFDSVYITGQLKNQTDSGIGHSSVIVNNKYTTVSDSKGYFKIRIPRNTGISKLLILDIPDGYLPVELSLSPFNNFHNLTIVVPFKDSASCIVINKSGVSSQDENNIILPIIKNQKIKFPGLSFISTDKIFILTKLTSAAKNQRYLEYNIKELIKLIEK